MVMEVRNKPTVCPNCGGKVVPIIYGEPIPETFESSERGEVVLGGCCVEVNEDGVILNPEWACVECNKQFIKA